MNRLILYLSALILLFGADSLVARNRPLNIGSYNIRCNNPGDGENAWPNRKERVKALILFHEYDVVGVQEARPEQMEDLQQMPGFASVGVDRDGEAGGEFSAIFYRVDRIQVLDSGTFWLSETPEKVSKGWDAALNRICTWAKMKDRATRRVFYFFNTHFDHIGPVARHKSAELLVARIRETVGEKYPVFCSGDFNSGAGSDPVEVMLSAFSDAEAVSQTPPYTPGWSYTDFGVKVPERLMKKGKIDFLFVNDRVTVLKFGILTDSDGRNHPSDHFPVFVEALLK